MKRVTFLTSWLLALVLPLVALGGLLAPEVWAAQAAPAIRELVIGTSAQGRPIEAVQIGDGPLKLAVVSNTHGGPEANTYRLTLELIAHFRAFPEQVPPSVRLYLIPTLNPDGLARGWRFDGVGVDLNRNMNTNLDACTENDWQVTVQGARGIVSDTGGAFPDSQTESQVIRTFLLDAAGAIFVHSNAGLVFPAFCEHAPSNALAETYATGAGYTYSRFWPFYTITGGMHDWAASLGIAAITPELVTGNQSEFAANLAGLQAVLANAEALLPPPADGESNGYAVPAPLWRYWRALGGEPLFGPALAPPRREAGLTVQDFALAQLILDPALADSPFVIQPAALGRQAAADLAYGGEAALAPAVSAADGRFFGETSHNLRGELLRFWERNGGLARFGFPLSEEFADWQGRAVQYFERAALAYDPASNQVVVLPLGTRTVQRSALEAAWQHHQIR